MPDCECDFDCEGDPLRYFRCNRKQLCPAHDTCEGDAPNGAPCENLATAIFQGEKLCIGCRALAQHVALDKVAEADEAARIS